MALINLEIGNPQYYICVLVPVAILVILILGVRKKGKILDKLRISLVSRFGITRTILLMCGICLMFLALLGPRKYDGFTEVKSQGLDIYFLIDTSNSMLVQDIQPDRVTRAKRLIGNLLDRLTGDRVGFIPFSSDAYVLMPLTDDYNMAKMFLDVIDTRMVGSGGTDFGPAIKLAQKSFNDASTSDKVIIILSDGEERRTSGADILAQAKDGQLKVFTVGIGTMEGGPVPVYSFDNTEIIDYIYDENFNEVISTLKPDSLKELAVIGGGKYFESTVSGVEAGYILDEISRLKRDSTKSRKVDNYIELYQYLLGPALLLILVSYTLPDTGRVK